MSTTRTTTGIPLLDEARDLIEQVLDDCDSRMEIRAGHGTGLISDMQRWRAEVEREGVQS